MMLLYKVNKYHKIMAEKHPAGFYTIYDMGKNIFGNSWNYIVLKDGLTRKQVLEIKQNINNL